MKFFNKAHEAYSRMKGFLQESQIYKSFIGFYMEPKTYGCGAQHCCQSDEGLANKEKFTNNEKPANKENFGELEEKCRE